MDLLLQRYIPSRSKSSPFLQNTNSLTVVCTLLLSCIYISTFVSKRHLVQLGNDCTTVNALSLRHIFGSFVQRWPWYVSIFWIRDFHEMILKICNYSWFYIWKIGACNHFHEFFFGPCIWVHCEKRYRSWRKFSFKTCAMSSRWLRHKLESPLKYIQIFPYWHLKMQQWK